MLATILVSFAVTAFVIGAVAIYFILRINHLRAQAAQRPAPVPALVQIWEQQVEEAFEMDMADLKALGLVTVLPDGHRELTETGQAMLERQSYVAQGGAIQ